MEKDEQEFALRCREHNPHVVRSLHQLWEDSHLTDVTLATETKTFKAHRLVLSACSPYFKNLFIANPCKHPTVFLKDIPERHIELLLQYMYQGSIAVKQHELLEILSTASSLKIHGLITADTPTLPSEDPDVLQPLVVDEQYNGSEAAMDKFHHLETGSNHSTTSGTSRKAEGRKSSKPKKIRLSGDTDSDISPRYPISLQEKEQRSSPVERTSSNPSPSDDNIAVSDDEKELVIDQPVDFSINNSESVKEEQKYSILGSYLQSGRTNANPDEGNYKNLTSNEMSENLRRAGLGSSWNSLNSLSRSAPRPASRDSRGYSKEECDTNEEDNASDENREYPQLSLSDTMGIDIADRLKAQMLMQMANFPGQNSWLNRVNGSSPLLEQVKREKRPSGGIR